MIAFLVRRLITMVWTLVGISVLVFVIIQLPPGDYLSTYIAEIQAQGERVGDEKIAFLREQYGLDKPLWQQYLVWVDRAAARRSRLFLRIQPAGRRRDRRPPVPDPGAEFLHGALHLRRLVPDRRLFRHASVQRRRPRALLPRLPRPRDAELPARADPALSRQRLVRHVDRRPDGPGIRRPAVERRARRSRCWSTSGCRSS